MLNLKIAFKAIIILLSLGTICFATKIKAPPPQTDAGLYNYLLDLKENLHSIPLTTTNPDGATPGNVGDVLLFDAGGQFFLEICVVASGPTWQGVVLTDTP